MEKLFNKGTSWIKTIINIPLACTAAAILFANFTDNELLQLGTFFALLLIIVIRKHDSRIPIAYALIILIISAFQFTFLTETAANKSAILAYYLLCVGVIAQFKEYLSNPEDAIPVEQACPECSESKYLAGSGKTQEVPIKLISVALAIIILLGIAWTLYPKEKEQPFNIQPEVETPAVTRIPSVTEIPVVAETMVPEITPTGNRTFISLDRHKVLRGISPSIRVRDEIIWVNVGLDRITVVSDNIPGFTEKILGVGKRTTPYMFILPGTYNYYLKGNKNVNGTIKVT